MAEQDIVKSVEQSLADGASMFHRSVVVKLLALIKAGQKEQAPARLATKEELDEAAQRGATDLKPSGPPVVGRRG